ncbi:MAG: glycosyltransferase family 2 protein [Elusimicrobia bacterium]|nr:glycosyltransferase family 2 protein [Candidatus Obscuribacterium magneticum]
MPAVAILITTHNRRLALKSCLESLVLQNFPKNQTALWIMDDGGTDGSDEIVTSFFDSQKNEGWNSLNFIRNDVCRNVVAARHSLELRVEKTKPAFLLVLDDDVTLEPHGLSEMISHLSSHPQTAAVGPRFCLASNPQQECHFPSFVNHWTSFYSHVQSAVQIDCDWLINACCLFRADSVYSVGGLDPSFFSSHEEVDLCLRLKHSGFTITYLPSVTALHAVELSHPKNERLYYLYRNKFFVIRKNFKGLFKITAYLAHIFLSFPKALISSVLRKPTGVIKELLLIVQSFGDGFRDRRGPKRGI